MKYPLISILITLLLCCSCSFAQQQPVSADEFEKQLIEANGEQLIDIRTPQEFEKYRIPGAKNINFRNPDFSKQIEELDKERPVFIYCLAGPRSKAALAVFRKSGFKTVYELDKGINGWLAAGKSVDQDLSGKGEISVADYNTITSSKGVVLVDFFAPWCAPCKKMLPVVNDLAKTYSGKFQLLTIDFDKNRLLINEKQVSSVPYLVVFKDGEKIWEKFGEASREELMEVMGLQ